MLNKTSGINYKGERQSCFELLRLISMFFIVLYHFLRWFVQDNPSHHVLQALWLPLHVGVVVSFSFLGILELNHLQKVLLN